MDAGYGKDPGLLRALESAGETFIANVHSHRHRWEQDPQPAPPCLCTGRRLGSAVKPASRSVTVKDWVARQSPDAWIPIKRREGTHASISARASGLMRRWSSQGGFCQ